MNKNFLAAQLRPIKHFLGHKKVRVRQTFLASARQMDFIRRINKVRKKIDMIPCDAHIIVALGRDPYAYKYLMELTALGKRDVIGIVGNAPLRIGNVHGSGSVLVQYPESADYGRVDCVLVADLNEKTGIAEAVRRVGYQGDIVEIYDENDIIPFYHVPTIDTKGEDSYSSLENNSNLSCIADEYYLKMLDRVDKINRKLFPYRSKNILVYCVGDHTDALLCYTDLQYMNVVGFIDRSCRRYKGNEVLPPKKESFEHGDCVVISSFRYQDEIQLFLKSLNINIPVVSLYDEDDVAEFYENENVYSPDFPYQGDSYRHYDNNEVYALAEQSMQKLTASSKNYVTYSIANNGFCGNISDVHYPGEPEVIKAKGYEAANRETALILQGPPVYSDNFTYNTIRHYKMIFPETRIILSTWKTEVGKEEFKPFREIGIEIVLSDTPQSPGVLNLNYQVLSTYNGLKRAKELGYKYAIKTRTDFRIYAEESLSFLRRMMHLFPTNDNRVEKLAILPPILDVPYYIPDFIMFGRTEDMMLFWEASDLYPDKSVDVNPEMMLFSRYFKLIGRYIDNPTEQLEEYIEVLSKYFIVTNASAFRYIWRKYTYESSMTYEERRNTFNFVDWLNRQSV